MGNRKHGNVKKRPTKLKCPCCGVDPYAKPHRPSCPEAPKPPPPEVANRIADKPF